MNVEYFDVLAKELSPKITARDIVSSNLAIAPVISPSLFQVIEFRNYRRVFIEKAAINVVVTDSVTNLPIPYVFASIQLAVPNATDTIVWPNESDCDTVPISTPAQVSLNEKFESTVNLGAVTSSDFISLTLSVQVQLNAIPANPINMYAELTIHGYLYKQ